MQIADIFNKITSTKREIRALEHKKHEVRWSMLPSGISYESTRVKTSKEDRMIKFVEKLEIIDNQIALRRCTLIDLYYVLDRVISKMPTSLYRLIITLKYCDPEKTAPTSWQEVADILNYDCCYVSHDLRKKAFTEAQEALDLIEEDVACLLVKD